MDFGLDCLVGSDQGSAPDAPPDSPEAKLKVAVGSGPFKPERPRSSVSSEHEEWRNSKLFKTTDDFSIPKAIPKEAATSNGIASLFWDAQHQQQMLSLSTSSSSSSSSSSTSHKLETLPNSHNTSTALPYLSYTPFSYNSFAGFSSGNLNGGGSIRGVLTGTRGSFTSSQWMELEHQALIYKYITANIPVPSNLLIPIKKAFDSAGFSCSPGGYLRSSPLGWGSFHLGFSNTGDPEPGRCRRTDGKKWRCLRDAVADQKYCEKHMNRGRHRSRKPVEGQNGHPVIGTATTAHASSRKMPVVTAVSAAGGTIVAVAPGCSASDSLATMAHHQQYLKSFLHPGVLSADASLKRFFVDQESVNHKKQNPNSLSDISTSKDNLFPLMKQQSTYEDTSRLQFTLNNSYSLFDCPNKNSSLLDFRGFASSLDQAGILETDTPHDSACQFIDDWQNSVDRSDTYLSISIPMASSDLISTTSSFPTNDKANLLPLRLLRKSDPVHVNLGVVGTIFGEPIHKQNISWESSLGGPLGEVLHRTGNNANNAESKNTSLLDLMNDGWDNSPSMGSSSRGILQKTTFRTLSNSSGGGSHCAEKNKSVNGINEHLASTLANPSSLSPCDGPQHQTLF